MKIGILGSGHIGRTIARRLAAAGHDVKVANSRGPETIEAETLQTGARAVTGQEALVDVDVAILSIPPTSFDKIKGFVDALPEDVTIIDTSNYYPYRDGEIAAIEAGQVEAEWVRETLSRPIVKAWNAVGTHSFDDKPQEKGHPERIAIPVAGDDKAYRDIAIALVDDTGFDGYDAGALSEAWRIQPGAPAYCTDLSTEEMGPALASTRRDQIAKRRDFAVAAITDRLADGDVPQDYVVRINRAIYM